MRTHGAVGRPQPDVSFVEQGLDSLKLAALSTELESRLGLEVPVERFYSITPRALADALEGDRPGLPDAPRADLAADLALAADLVPAPSGPARWQVLLVTGVTGFLGAFLLSELLRQTDADLLWLVRARDREEGLDRIRANLALYGLWQDGLAARIRVQPSALDAPRLGLSEARWARLAGQITAVYHCGAHVHWGMPYAQLRDANVEGTTALVRLACEAGCVPFHFVSSLGVFPVGISPRDRFEEDDALLDGENLDLGYFQTKWVAERRLQQARDRGVPVTVYRPHHRPRRPLPSAAVRRLPRGLPAARGRAGRGQGDRHRARRRRGPCDRRPVAPRTRARLQPAPTRAAPAAGPVRPPARAATRSRGWATPGGAPGGGGRARRAPDRARRLRRASPERAAPLRPGDAKQWRASERIDWSLSTDADNPLALPEHAQPLHGSEIFRRMNERERVELRVHVQSWQLSQFLHGEQGALLCASKIVQHAPTLEARLFAGTQVADEARHVEIFDRLLTERFGHRYPITPPLKRLLDDVLTDSRWDLTYLGMHDP